MSDTNNRLGIPPEKKKRSNFLVRLALTVSLALNMFAVGWFVTQTIVKDRANNEQAGSLSGQNKLNEAVLMEQYIVKRLTADLSTEGVGIFMEVYTKHMALLSGMGDFAKKFNAKVAEKIRSEDVTEQELRETFKPLPVAIMRRVSVMTNILAEAIPRLSNKDRMSLPPMRSFSND